MLKLTFSTLSFFIICFSLSAQDYTYYNNLAKEEYDKKNYYNVIDYANKSLNASSNGAGYWYRGMGRYYLNNYSDAVVDFTSAISYYMSDYTSLASLYYWRASCRYNQKNYKEAIIDFESAKSYGYENKLNMYWCLAFSNYSVAEYKKAIEYYSSTMNYTSDNSTLAQLYKGRGDAQYELFNNKDAVSDYSKAIEYNAGYSSAFWARAISRAFDFNYDMAIGDYTSAINIVERENKPESISDRSILYSNRGRLYYLLGKDEEAKTDLEKSLSLDPNNDKANWNMADILYSLKNYKEASRYYVQAASLLKKDADKVSCYRSLYLCSINVLDYNQALSYINSAIQLDSSYGDSYNKRAYVWMVKKNYASALTNYDKAIDIYSKDQYGFSTSSLSYAYVDRARLKMKLKDNNGAFADLQKAAEADSTSAFALEWLVRFCKNILKQNDKVLLYSQKVIKLSTQKDTTSEYMYAKVVKGEKTEAINVGLRLIKKDADDKSKLTWDLYNLACVYAISGDPVKSIQYLDKAFAAGYDNFDHIYNDEDWNALRSSPAFKAVLVKYKCPLPKL